MNALMSCKSNCSHMFYRIDILSKSYNHIIVPPENFPAFMTLFFGARLTAQATTADGGFAFVALL